MTERKTLHLHIKSHRLRSLLGRHVVNKLQYCAVGLLHGLHAALATLSANILQFVDGVCRSVGVGAH